MAEARVKRVAECDVEGGWPIGSASGAQVAQTFSPSKRGDLVEARFQVRQDPGDNADYVVSINRVDKEGTPTNQALARDRIRAGSLREGPIFLNAEFSGRLELSPQREYALVVWRPEEFTWLTAIPSSCPSRHYINTGPDFPWMDFFGDDRDVGFAVSVRT